MDYTFNVLDLGMSGVIILIFALAITALVVTCFWQILKKAGYPGPLSLLVLVPGLGQLAALIIIIMLAFGKWPVYEKLSQGTMDKDNK
ncbi:MAG: hypothetical protein P9M01_04205 [Candidatus Kappaea frigidicola]|nr:hypothetical protein [Candidatus Kappaea frigidicola]